MDNVYQSFFFLISLISVLTTKTCGGSKTDFVDFGGYLKKYGGSNQTDFVDLVVT